MLGLRKTRIHTYLIQWISLYHHAHMYISVRLTTLLQQNSLCWSHEFYSYAIPYNLTWIIDACIKLRRIEFKCCNSSTAIATMSHDPLRRIVTFFWYSWTAFCVSMYRTEISLLDNVSPTNILNWTFYFDLNFTTYRIFALFVWMVVSSCICRHID